MKNILRDVGIIYYDCGTIKASVEHTSSGYFKTIVKDDRGTYEHMFSDLASALCEIMSYCEIDSDDF